VAKPYKTSKRRREAALRRYDQIREEQGKDPLDRNPVPSTFCHGCRWLQDRCVRPEGPCSFNPVGPSEECLYRYKNQRCPYFRRACRMRACDCPYWPHESFKCQHCGTMVPHQETAFALNRTSGLTEVKKRGYGPNRPSMVFCRQCLTGLQQSDDQTIEQGCPVREEGFRASSGRQSPARDCP